MSALTTPQTAGDLAARQRAYAEVVTRLRDLIHHVTAPGSTVLVVSKGDEELLALVGRRGWHFLQDDNGSYAGYHPRDSASAIEALEAMRGRGADFLAIPATSTWWLTHYADFGHHLHRQYETVAEQPEGIVFGLRPSPPAEVAGDPAHDGLDRHRSTVLAAQLADLMSYLVPRDHAVVLIDTAPAALQLEGWATTHVRVDAEPGAAADAGALVAKLENLRQRGPGTAIITARAFDWWEAQEDLRTEVERRYRLVTRQAHVCLIVDLDRAEDCVDR